MRKIAITLAAAAAAVVATPALANEGRVETRGGIVWGGGNEEAIAGVAAGYDFGAAEGMFVGVEGSADKVLANGTDVFWGATARIGGHVGTNGKLYALGGYSFGKGEDVPHAGAGYEHRIGAGGTYLKTEYRHYFSDFADSNTVTVGIGFKF